MASTGEKRIPPVSDPLLEFKDPRKLFDYSNDPVGLMEIEQEKEEWESWQATEARLRAMEAREAAKPKPKPKPKVVAGKPRMGDQKHPITILDEKAAPWIKVYKNAFLTKFQKGKPEEKRTIPVEPPRAVPRKMASEWYSPGTWLMDLVNFGSMWYVFFVEANSRYLIALPGNFTMVGEGFGYTSTPRVVVQGFEDIFNKFLQTGRGDMIMNSAGKNVAVEARPVKGIIGDSEKVFW